VVVSRLIGGRPTILETRDADAIKKIDSVRDVRPRVWGYVFVPALQGNVTVVGVPKGLPALDSVAGALAEGHDLTVGTHEMVAGATLAKYLGIAIGDAIALPTISSPLPALTLVGTFSSKVDLYAADVILCDETDARAILGLPPDAATDLAVTVINPAEARVIARTIVERLPGTRVIEKDLLGRVYALVYGRRAGLVLAASIPALLALLILAWDRASGLGPEEKREIAVLKAIGWSTSDVLWSKLLEAILVSAVATTSGLFLAYVWVFSFGAPGLRQSIVGWSVLYPTGPLTPAVDLAQLLALALAVVAPFVGLSIVPARSSAGPGASSSSWPGDATDARWRALAGRAPLRLLFR
jgi:ABC-type lipoprotein release transport system permease subunit